MKITKSNIENFMFGVKIAIALMATYIGIAFVIIIAKYLVQKGIVMKDIQKTIIIIGITFIIGFTLGMTSFEKPQTPPSSMSEYFQDIKDINKLNVESLKEAGKWMESAHKYMEKYCK